MLLLNVILVGSRYNICRIGVINFTLVEGILFANYSFHLYSYINGGEEDVVSLVTCHTLASDAFCRLQHGRRVPKRGSLLHVIAEVAA